MQSYLQKLIDYNYWAHQRVWDCVLTLSEEQFTQTSDYSLGAVKSQMVHIMWAEEIWLNRIVGSNAPLTYQVQDFPNAASIQTHWAEVERRMREFVAKTNEDTLRQTMRYQNATGPQFQQSVFEILLHVVNHGTDHRAQILALLHQLGAQTVAQDMIAYLRA